MITIRAFDDARAAAEWAAEMAENNPTTYGPGHLGLDVTKAGLNTEINLPSGALYVVISSPDAPL